MSDAVIYGVGGLVLGLAVGWRVHAWFVRKLADAILKKALGKDVDTLVKEATEALPENKSDTLEVKVEEHNGHFYVFRDSDDKFLAQGATFDQIKELMKDYEDTPVVAVNTDPEVLKRLKATKAAA